MTEFEQYIENLLAAARVQGLSALNPVLFSPIPGNIIFMGYSEPSGYVLPLNVLWVQANPQSSSYRTVRQRSSKTPSGGFQNTWATVTTMNAVTQPQFWADADIPAPVIVSGKGGKLSGRLYCADNIDRFQPLEFVARYYVDDRLAQYFMTMGLRVDAIETNVSALQASQTAIGQRVSALEGRQAAQLVFRQETEEAQWNLLHNLGPGYGVVICTDEEGRAIWPETSGVGPNPNTYVVRFLQPVSGSCLLIYVPTPA